MDTTLLLVIGLQAANLVASLVGVHQRHRAIKLSERQVVQRDGDLLDRRDRLGREDVVPSSTRFREPGAHRSRGWWGE